MTSAKATAASVIDFTAALTRFRDNTPPPLEWRTWFASRMHQAIVDPDGPLLKGQAAAIGQRFAVQIGLGAVGGRTFVQLARLQIGFLLGVDLDRFGEFSWKTQLAEPGHNGQVKAWVLGELAHRIHPATRIWTAHGLAQELPLTLLRRADVLLAAGDNIEVMIWAGTIAAALGKPLIQGAVYGETHSVIARAYDLRDADAPCPACALGGRQWAGVKARRGCDSLPTNSQPTRTAPHLCALASDLQTAEALKWLEGREQSALRNEQLDLCVLTHKSYRSQLARSTSCKCPHERWRWHDLAAGAADIPLGEVVAATLGAESRRNRLLQVRAEASWCPRARCQACGRLAEIARFARPGQDVGQCLCGYTLQAAATEAQSVLPACDLDAALNKTLGELGLGDGAALGLGDGDGWTYLALPGGPLPGLDPIARTTGGDA